MGNNELCGVVELAQELVKTPSVNGVHPELAVANVVVDFARTHGLDAEIIGQNESRPNVVVTLGPVGEPALTLLAHMDTVSTGDLESWRFHPFSGSFDRVSGRLFGRGAADNKGGLAAALWSLLLLRDHVKKLARPVHVVCVPDEESGATGELGVNFLLDRGKLGGRCAIYTYPGTRRVIIGHRGVLRLELATVGRSTHSGSLAWQEGRVGKNAVAAMAEILLKLESLEMAYAAESEFKKFKTMITPGTLIHGGSGESMVPGRCEATVDVRLVPGISREEVLECIRGAVEDVSVRRSISVSIAPRTYLPPTLISGDALVVNAVREAMRRLTGRVPATAVSGPANESYILNSRGIETCAFGPDGGNVHGIDEFVDSKSLMLAARVYAEVANFLQGELRH